MLEAGAIRAYWLSQPKRGELDKKLLYIWKTDLPSPVDPIPAVRGGILRAFECHRFVVIKRTFLLATLTRREPGSSFAGSKLFVPPCSRVRARLRVYYRKID